MNEQELIKQLEERFGAERIEDVLNREEIAYLDKRDQLFSSLCWDFDEFVKHYQLIKRYGLEEKCLETLAWKIEHFLEKHEILELKKTVFHQNFSNHQLIKNSLIERELI